MVEGDKGEDCLCSIYAERSLFTQFESSQGGLITLSQNAEVGHEDKLHAMGDQSNDQEKWIANQD